VLSYSLKSGNTLGLRTGVGYGYNAVGQRTRATRENGYYWQYNYNTRGEVTSAKKHQPGSGSGQVLGGLQFEYQYDAIGNRTLSKFGGDQNGGDLRTIQYTVNSHNQYLSVNRTDSNPDHGAHYVVGYAGIPTSSAPNAIEVNNVAHNPDVPIPTLDFLYDWKGRRIAKMVTLGTVSTFTGYVYDGWNIVATLEQLTPLADLKIVRSVWGLDLSGGFQGAGGVGGLLATRTAESIYNSASYSYPTPSETERHFPSFDGNGNIIAWTDDTGATTTTRDFDAFGNVVTNEGTRWSASTPYGFSTKYEDVETGLLYYGFRHYDPVTGRWPSRDPIGERGGINLYGMVGNSPVTNIDYLGLLTVVAPLPKFDIDVTVKGASKNQINNATDALAHYRSNAGGSVPAGPDLIETVQNSDALEDAHDDLRVVIEKQLMKEVGRKKLCSCATGKVSRKAGKIGLSIGDLALGHIDLNIKKYDVNYNGNGSFLGIRNISFWLTRKASFNEKYIFTTTWNPATWATDFFPGLIAGDGTPYFITGSFDDKVKGGFNINCWGQ